MISRKKMPLKNEGEIKYLEGMETLLKKSKLSDIDKFFNFPVYSQRQRIAEFIMKYEIFKKIKNIQGSIVECGVLNGFGLMSFAHFSSILEPVNFNRKIIGFDSFEGFPSVSKKDNKGGVFKAKKGNLKTLSFDELQQITKLYDLNRSVGHINKIELVKGNAIETIPKYLKKNPHLIVSLLYLDFDLYEPTKIALKNFIPRMPKGSIIAFDELNHPDWPGETMALFEEIGIKNIKIERFYFDSIRSYAIL
tara:strand:- start:140 stop:889 length:750 start_codon:yes stop_codon:yes gene_type:complete